MRTVIEQLFERSPLLHTHRQAQYGINPFVIIALPATQAIRYLHNRVQSIVLNEFDVIVRGNKIIYTPTAVLNAIGQHIYRLCRCSRFI